jgi:hypothetical protein
MMCVVPRGQDAQAGLAGTKVPPLGGGRSWPLREMEETNTRQFLSIRRPTSQLSVELVPAFPAQPVPTFLSCPMY